jgi:hypothetical protein
VDRYYDPTTDQFLSVDPDLAETGQPYAFTGDDPLNKTDPLGLKGGPGPGVVNLLHRKCANPRSKNCSAAKKKVNRMEHPKGSFTSFLKAFAVAATFVATVPLDETGAGEAIDAGVAGDLTADESAQIQSVVNQANRPLNVVGSAARGERTAESDIDYTASPSSVSYFKPFVDQLPGLDSHGILQGEPDGPFIPFNPEDPVWP